LNQLSADAFAEALRPLFEAADPLARGLYARRPFESYDTLLDTAERVANELTVEDQARILSAHPRIGENPEAVRQASAISYAEQGYAGEDSLPGDEVQRVYSALAELNAEYEQRFGFRFVVFVNKRPKSEIVKVLEARLRNSRDQELRTGLHDMFSIARDRYRTFRQA
jgi:OHCU decarboxylase